MHDRNDDAEAPGGPEHTEAYLVAMWALGFRRSEAMGGGLLQHQSRQRLQHYMHEEYLYTMRAHFRVIFCHLHLCLIVTVQEAQLERAAINRGARRAQEEKEAQDQAGA